MDSSFHGHGYATDDSRRIFCDLGRLQRFLDVEVALARSQATLGLIPAAAAFEIARSARVDGLDLDDVRNLTIESGHSLVGLLHVVRRRCRPPAGEWLHFGATTQDIQDTAQSLEIREVLDVLDGELTPVLRRLGTLATDHRDTLMVGRTHGEPALPITFGLKVAGWIDELLRHRQRLCELRPRILVAELFGGTGTMAAFAGVGPELLREFARRLDLGVPATAWHTARDRVVEFVSAMAMISGTLGRVADELRNLYRLREVLFGWQYGQVGSSTMPHKRNPEASEQVVVCARLAKAQVGIIFDGLIHEHERDSRSLRLEWAAVADVGHYVLAAARIARDLLEGLTVDAPRMSDHAHVVAHDLCTEALVFRLASSLGKETALQLIYDLSQEARDGGVPLRTRLMTHPTVRTVLDLEALEATFDPRAYLGASGRLIDDVLERLRSELLEDDTPMTLEGDPGIPS